MAFSWSALTQYSSKLLYSYLTELRTNADWLDNNRANRTYNSPVHSGDCAPVHSGDCSPVHSGDCIGVTTGCGPVDSGQDIGANAIPYATGNNPYNQSVCSPAYSDYGGNCVCGDCTCNAK